MITFKQILAEIGINNPNRLKATRINSSTIRIDDFYFFLSGNGEYYYFYFYKNDNFSGLKRHRFTQFQKWRYFSRFKKIGETNIEIGYGIPKDQVQVIDET